MEVEAEADAARVDAVLVRARDQINDRINDLISDPINNQANNQAPADLRRIDPRTTLVASRG